MIYFRNSETLFHFEPIKSFADSHTIISHSQYSKLFTEFLTMSSSPTPQDQWRLIFDITLLSLLFLVLLLALLLIFFKQKNVPVSQCIEVDPREPHSITITFVPTSANNISMISTNNNNNTNNTSNVPGSTVNAPDAAGMTQRNESVLSSNGSQTAPLA